MGWWNADAGSFLRSVREHYNLNQSNFESANVSTVGRWENGIHEPNPAHYLEIRRTLGVSRLDLRNAAEQRPFSLEVFAHTHPHKHLLWDLRFAIQDGLQKEVLGPPGMLYEELCDAAELGLNPSGQKIIRVKAASMSTFAEIRRQCAAELNLSKDACDHGYIFLREVKDQQWVLLVEDLDQLCARRYNEVGREKASAEITRWLSDIHSSRVPTLSFGTLKIRSLVVAAGGSPKPFQVVKFDSPKRCSSWDDWTANAVVDWPTKDWEITTDDGPPIKAADGSLGEILKKIRAHSHEHPTAFLQGLKYLNDHRSCSDRLLKEHIDEEHKQIAHQIYSSVLPDF